MFVSVTDMEKARAFLSDRSSWSVKLAISVLRSVGQVLGVPAGIELPDYLVHYHSSVWDAFPTLQKAQQFGIVRRLSHDIARYADEPFLHTTIVELEGEEKLGYAGIAFDVLGLSETVWPALGEAFERWALVHPSISAEEMVRSSYTGLSRGKVNILSLPGYDAQLRARADLPFDLSYDATTPFEWVKACSFPEGGRVYAPRQWFDLPYALSLQNRAEPLLSPVLSTGAAAGRTLKEAILRGLLEIIERDAFMVYWLAGLVPSRLDAGTIKNKKFQKVLRLSQECGLELSLVYLKTDVPVHVIFCFLLDKSGRGPAVLVGGKAGFELGEVAYGAAKEALGFRNIRRTALAHNPPSPLPVKEIAHHTRGLYWSLPERIQDISPFLSGTEQSAAVFTGKCVGGVECLTLLTDFFAAKHYPIFFRSLLEEKLANSLDVQVVMVKVPSMQPMFMEENMPALSGPRLDEISHYLGHKREGLNPLPHPFS